MFFSFIHDLKSWRTSLTVLNSKFRSCLFEFWFINNRSLLKTFLDGKTKKIAKWNYTRKVAVSSRLSFFGHRDIEFHFLSFLNGLEFCAVSRNKLFCFLRRIVFDSFINEKLKYTQMVRVPERSNLQFPRDDFLAQHFLTMIRWFLLGTRFSRHPKTFTVTIH